MMARIVCLLSHAKTHFLRRGRHYQCRYSILAIFIYRFLIFMQIINVDIQQDIQQIRIVIPK